jgi:hypothetical protein
VPEVLELPHLVEQHGMAQVQVGRGRVETGLDPQRPAGLEPGLQFLALEDLVGSAADQFQGVVDGHGRLMAGRET